MIVALIGLLTLSFMIIIASKRQHENEDALMAIKQRVYWLSRWVSIKNSIW